MQLKVLLQHVDVLEVHGSVDRWVDHVTRDSRDAGSSSVFVAIVGAHVDGHDFVSRVDAEVVVVQHPCVVADGVTQVRVADSKRALAQVAAALNGFPANDVRMVGITGTNGKTTVATLAEAALRSLGVPTGRIGTSGNVVGGDERASRFTTPEAPQLQALLAEMRGVKIQTVTMEVSSHGLDQHRVDAIPFDLAVFTNLTPDHLDYHGTMEAYGEAKARLFRELLRPPGGAVRALLCGDDPAWPTMDPPADRWLYGTTEGCDLRLEDLRSTAEGIRATLCSPMGSAPLHSALLGHHNAMNLLAAFGILLTQGVSAEAAGDALSTVPGVPGRLERVEDAGGRLVVVDFAHSEDALDNALRTLRPLTDGDLWVVFGCGGDRDASKRPKMGAVAASAADRIVVTSDNPRTESPATIVEEILAGIEDRERVVAIVDRADAVAHALGGSRAGDTVLIAGKGHETYQEIGGTRIPFDDRYVARTILEGM